MTTASPIQQNNRVVISVSTDSVRTKKKRGMRPGISTRALAHADSAFCKAVNKHQGILF